MSTDFPDTSIVRWFLRLRRRDKVVLAVSALAFCLFFVDPLVYHGMKQLNPNVRAVFHFVTDVGKSGWILGLTGIGFLVCRLVASRTKCRRLKVSWAYVGQLAGFVFIAIAATGLAADIIKIFVGRARPKLFESLGPFHFSPFVFRAEFYSFPSGHATTMFALATALALLWPRGRVLLFTGACWIGLSRVVICAHYLSDVMAGAALGTFGTLAVRDIMARSRLVFRPGPEHPLLRGRRVWQAVLSAIRSRIGRGLAVFSRQ